MLEALRRELETELTVRLCQSQVFGLGKSPSSCKMRTLDKRISKAMAPHSSALAWRIPWMEEPGGLQSMGS